jgi:hypothetical protein
MSNIITCQIKFSYEKYFVSDINQSKKIQMGFLLNGFEVFMYYNLYFIKV